MQLFDTKLHQNSDCPQTPRRTERLKHTDHKL